MSRRYNNIEATIKKNLTDPTTGVIKQGLDLSGTVAGNYLDYKAGKRKLSYPREPNSKPGSLITIGVLPFAIANTADPVPVLFSKRAKDAIANLGITATDLNHFDDPPGRKVRGFRPAKATIFKVAQAQVDTKVDSQITGAKYDPKEGASYTFPFGQKTGGTGNDTLEAGVAGTIRAALADDEKISFKPERYPA